VSIAFAEFLSASLVLSTFQSPTSALVWLCPTLDLPLSSHFTASFALSGVKYKFWLPSGIASVDHGLDTIFL
jgi:hypothetical protein